MLAALEACLGILDTLDNARGVGIPNELHGEGGVHGQKAIQHASTSQGARSNVEPKQYCLNAGCGAGGVSWCAPRREGYVVRAARYDAHAVWRELCAATYAV
eukprot:3272014-Pyramimonas_sp.AAC.1